MGVLGISGLTASEHRQVIHSEYTVPGILSGCELDPSSSSMALTLRPGAAVIPMSGTESVKAPVPSATITLDAAPATGQDVYDIVATVSASGAVTVSKLKNASSLPASTVRIDGWVIPAGATSAAGGWAVRARQYAVPVGSGQARLVWWRDPSAFGVAAARGLNQQLVQRIYVPQDRLLDFRISQSFSAQKGGPAGSFQWTITDDVAGRLTSPVLPYDAWPSAEPMSGCTYQNSHLVGLQAGWHTLTWERRQITGGQPIHVAGTSPADQGAVTRPANSIEVFDVGIVS